jgi:DNA polymerase-3 subunit epsilon
MYAIVDIETTGGYAANNAITEVAIVLHDGNRELKRYETLVNPAMAIPRYVQALTGITDEMVADAPYFNEIAPFVYEWLHSAIFVAHNVNFDYSFLKHQLKACGFDLDCKKLCTVRLSRKAFPGAPGYGLGKICRHLDIEIPNRHRAGGDADATVLLFERILATGAQEHIPGMLKGKNKEQYLPVHLPAEQLERLPEQPGVYYFHDGKGKVIYVGKAKNLRKRVTSHFSNNKPGRQKQEFLRNIHAVTYETTGTELMAFLLECIEIRRLWPIYNRSLKRFEQIYGLYIFEDRNGYTRLAIEKKRPRLQPVYSFSMLTEGHSLLWKLIREWKLCPKLCFIQTGEGLCEGVREHYCHGACEQKEGSASYNERVRQALQSLTDGLPSFGLLDEGRNPQEKSCILVEQGRFYGMGYLPAAYLPAAAPLTAGYDRMPAIGELKPLLTPYPENDYIRGLVYQHVEKWPAKKFDLRLVTITLALSLFFISCHSPSADQAATGADSATAKPPVNAIHNPEFRQQVKKEAVAEYTAKMHDPLNPNWFFSVRLYETSKTLAYRVNMRYEELEADDTLKLPDLGTPPKPVIQKGKDSNSCMIGFMDSDNQFREYKLVSVKGDQLAIKAVKHYAVTQGYRLVDEDSR